MKILRFELDLRKRFYNLGDWTFDLKINRAMTIFQTTYQNSTPY
jgi:hypothetical protein